MSHLRDSSDEGPEPIGQGDGAAADEEPGKQQDPADPTPAARDELPALDTRLPHFATRTWLSIVVGLGALIHLGALRTGFLLDDFIHESMLRGTFPAARHPLDLYNFVDDSDRAEMMERGILPWWTHPELTIRFFRPLSSALIWLDHRLLGQSALLMHLHSLAWWVAMVLAAFALYRAFLGERVARIAVLVFALAPAHSMPIAWLANRDALISLALGIPALLVYTRARESRSTRDVLLSFALFSLAFLGGEYTLSFVAYVLTFEIVRARDSLGRRIVGILPFAVPCAVYMAVRTSLHYGTIGSGYYNDPFRAPGLFLFFAPHRLATLVLEAWLSLDNETVSWSYPWWLVVGAGVLVLVLVVQVVRHVLRQSDPGPRRAAAWLGVGSLVAMIPVLAVVPNQRVLGAAMLGVAPLVALVLDGAWFPRALPPRRGIAELAQMCALGLGFAHLIHGPVTGAILDDHYRESSEQFERQMVSLRQLGGAALTDPLIVRASGGAFFAPFGMFEDRTLPRRFAVLAWATHVLVVRTGERSFDIFASPETGVFPFGEGNLYLDTAWALEVGQVFPGAGYTVTIAEMQDGRTTGIHVDLDEDYASRAFLNETEKAFYQADLPPEGAGRPYESTH